MQTHHPATGEMGQRKIYSDNTADELIQAPRETSIYSNLTAEELISLLVEGSSFAASQEERPVPDSGVDTAIEPYPGKLDENVILSGVSGEAVEEVIKPAQSTANYRGNDNIPNAANGHASDQVVQLIFPTNPIATSTTTNVVPRSHRHNSGPYTCPHCGVQHPTLSSHRNHLIIHEPANLSCPTCRKVVKRKNALVRHMKLHQETWVCNGATEGPCGDNGCGRMFTRKDAMLRHFKSLNKAREKTSGNTVTG
ncbi:hypothetical protein Q9L58_009455 [Maublancomyces gigas]|uniref:C2H2-type domain-containing protein n=1 Tax=Discina gigas TaxID=1032678 RepID=A0ABR3G7C7_9PEZI